MNTPDKAQRVADEIAKTLLRIESLDAQNRDRLDFHEVHVSALRRALVRAYELGRDAAKDPKPHCGTSARYTERDLSGQRVVRITEEYRVGAARMGWTVRCGTCGSVGDALHA
jgi:hypothetical protein